MSTQDRVRDHFKNLNPGYPHEIAKGDARPFGLTRVLMTGGQMPSPEDPRSLLNRTQSAVHPENQAAKKQGR